MITNDNKKGKNLGQKFYCESCDYICYKIYDWDRHISTRKHQNGNKMVTNGNISGNNDKKRAKKGQLNDVTKMEDKINELCNKKNNEKSLIIKSMGEKRAKKGQIFYATEMEDTNCNILVKSEKNTEKKRAKKGQNNNTTEFKCICGNNYKFNSGLSRHKKTCSYSISMNEEENNKIISHSCSTDVITKDQLINMLLSNQEIMKTVVEKMPKMGVNQANNTNSFNNQTFNIQMFLNENCKNAMNLTDFIDSLPITNETYDNTIENGLTKTISNMVVNGLNNLDITDRPIHCTDSNRKVLYVKEANKWEKDNELLLILEGIKKLASKQRTRINKWKDSNEGWEGNENLQNKLTSLVFNSFTDVENDDKETNKIIKAISKKVYLDNEVKKNYLSNI